MRAYSPPQSTTDLKTTTQRKTGAVLVIKNGSTKLVNIKNQDTVTKVLDLIPDLVDKFTAPKDEMMDDDAAVDIAFPEEVDDGK